jgi:hypothetical protein
MVYQLIILFSIMISINYWIAGTDSDHVFDIVKIVLLLSLACIMFFLTLNNYIAFFCNLIWLFRFAYILVLICMYPNIVVALARAVY